MQFFLNTLNIPKELLKIHHVVDMPKVPATAPMLYAGQYCNFRTPDSPESLNLKAVVTNFVSCCAIFPTEGGSPAITLFRKALQQSMFLAFQFVARKVVRLLGRYIENTVCECVAGYSVFVYYDVILRCVLCDCEPVSMISRYLYEQIV